VPPRAAATVGGESFNACGSSSRRAATMLAMPSAHNAPITTPTREDPAPRLICRPEAGGKMMGTTDELAVVTGAAGLRGGSVGGVVRVNMAWRVTASDARFFLPPIVCGCSAKPLHVPT